MRLRRSRLGTYRHKTKITKQDKEGGTYEEYEAAHSFTGEVWPGGGKLQAEMYGDRLPYVRNVRIEGRYSVKTDEKGIPHYIFAGGLDIVEGDGLCLYVPSESEPDYRIVSIKPYRFLTLEAERRIT